jgi:hypothetical protein
MGFKKYIWIVGLSLLVRVSGSSESYYSGTENKNEPTVSLYPNPATSGQVVINADKEIYKIELLTILGERILTEEPERSTSVRFDLKDLKNGIYIVKITFIDNTGSTKKLWVK